MISAIRKETFENLQLNAGMFVANFDYSAINDKAALEDAVADFDALSEEDMA